MIGQRLYVSHYDRRLHVCFYSVWSVEMQFCEQFCNVLKDKAYNGYPRGRCLQPPPLLRKVCDVPRRQFTGASKVM